MLTIIKMGGKVILITMIAGIVIGGFGYLNKWDTSLKYSNAFFIAGSLLFVAAAFSRLGAGRDWNNFQLLYAESFRNLSRSERVNFLVKASSSSMVILVLLSGILLILISAFVLTIF
jgi:hypothetical protein